MSQEHDIKCLRTTSLVKEIERIAQNEDTSYLWANNKVFKDFIKQLYDFVPNSEENWENDSDFLTLIKTVNDKIITQLKKGKEPMIEQTAMAIGTKLAIATGTISLIAIALYAYRCQKNKLGKNHNAKNEDSSLKTVVKTVVKKIREKIEEIVEEETSDEILRRTEEQSKKEIEEKRKSKTSQKVIYAQYNLLLIIEANRLDKNLKLGSFSKENTEKLILGAIRAYCFVENDIEGKKVLAEVECSSEDINYELESRVFLQLSLSATPEIIEKRDSLGIKNTIDFKKAVRLETLKKLETARSTTNFYSI